MPHLIIKFPRKPDTLFEIDQMETVIGRGDECDLVLSNLSVSRQHAKLIYEDLICKIVDLGSDNGIIRKQEKVEEAILESRDEVIIGNFTLIYLGNAPEDQFYRQRSIRYMPKYEADKAKPSQQDTFQLSPQEAQKMVKERNRLNNGCIEDSLGRIYYLESKTVTFGKKTCPNSDRRVVYLRRDRQNYLAGKTPPNRKIIDDEITAGQWKIGQKTCS